MKISIIVPVFSVEKYIAQCAKSLFIQKGAELEFIFVNDNTEDSSIEVLNNIINNDFPKLRKNILIINNSINKGIPLSRKAGIMKATGDYIMFVDSDDWLAPCAVEYIVKSIESTKADLICFDNYNYYDDHTEIAHLNRYTNKMDYIKDMIALSSNSPAYCWNKVAKRELYHNVKEWPSESMHEDVALMPQIVFEAESLSFIDEPLYYYRRTSTSSMSLNFQKSKEKRRQSKENQLLLLRFLERKHLKEIYLRQYRQLVIRCAYITAFFNCYNTKRDFNYIPVLWKYPLYWNFDVSIRRQLQSRLTIYIKHFIKYLNS